MDSLQNEDMGWLFCEDLLGYEKKSSSCILPMTKQGI